MSVVFPESASITLRLVTGSALTYEQMDTNWSNLQITDQEIINVIEGAAYTGSSNTFTEPQLFLNNVGITGSLSANWAEFSGQITSTFPGVGFNGTASWAMNTVGSGGGVGTLQQVTSLGNQTNQGIGITGSLLVNGLNVSQSIAELYNRTSSISASYAATASYFFTSSVSTASFVATASNAITASYINPLTQSVNILGDLNVNGAITASIIYTQVITSSVAYVTGSTIFGSSSLDTHQFTGSVQITGSLISPNITGSLFGTASYALTSSYISNNNLGILVASSVQNQLAAAINTPYSMSFETSAIEDGIYIDAVTDSGSIVFENTGIYNIQFSAQAEASGNGEIYIWFRKNDTDFAESNSKVHIKNAEPLIAAWNFIEYFAAGDKLKIMWAVSNSNIFLSAVGAPPVGPVIPSVIVTVTQIK